MIKRIDISEIDTVLSILKQDSIRGYNGLFAETERPWISHFITDSHNCFAFGLYENKELISVILSEKLSFNGSILWYIATKESQQGLGYGSKLLEHFENELRQIGIEWIFLNATDNSLAFYNKRNYITSEFSKVYEHAKDL